MSSTCFWTDLVGTAQVCPAEQEPEPPSIIFLDNFVFGPVQNIDGTAIVRASNNSFTSWAVPPDWPAGEFSFISYGPGLILFEGAQGFLFFERNEWSYYNCNAILKTRFGDDLNQSGVAPSLPFGYSNGLSFVGSGSGGGIGRAGSSPPFIRHPAPIVAEDSRWWAPSVGSDGIMYTDDGGAFWVDPVSGFPASLAVVALAARSGIVASVCRSTASANTSNRLVWSTNGGVSWSNIALAAGPVESLAIAASPTQVYRAAGTGNANAQFSSTTALGTATNVGGAFPKRRAWFTGTAWLVERLSSPVQIQRYTDLSTTGTSVFSFPAGTTPCGAFLAMGGGRIVVPVLLSTPANHVDFYVSTDDGLTFTLAPGMRLDIGDGAVTGYTHGFTIAYRAPS